MDFDQMLDAWKAQDRALPEGVNHDLLQLVLRHEQADVRRDLSREQWITYGVGTGMAAVAAAALCVSWSFRGPAPFTAMTVLGLFAFCAWMGGLWLSLRRQRRRERAYGSSLRDEIARQLSLLDYQLARYGRWSAALLWAAPVIVGAGIILWFGVEINLDAGESRWDQIANMLVLLWLGLFLPYGSSAAVRRKLGPRRQRLASLLDTLAPAP